MAILSVVEIERLRAENERLRAENESVAQALADCERETRKEVEAETVEACAGWLVTAAGAPGGLVRGECESMAKALRSGAWKQGDGETP